jgi:regulator of ribonuclease activity A
MKTAGNFQLPTLSDLCDEHVSSPTRLSVVEPGLFFPFGKLPRYFGRIATVRCFESNTTVREVLSSPGYNQVLVVDGGGSKRVALLGDQIAQLAIQNNWAGVIVNGCIRDSAIINDLNIGVRALGTHPVKSLKDYPGEKEQTCRFGGVEFVPGQWVYVDEDGILVSPSPLHGNEHLNKLVGVI